jgi:predicted DNA-binding ribbon-helix-helix protein
MPSSKGEALATKGRCMKRSISRAKSRAQLLQKRLVLLKRRNHWQIVLDHLLAAAEEDRIGDPAEPARQLDDLHRQLAALDRVLGTRSRNEQTKSRMVRRSLVIAGRKTTVSLEDDFWHLFEDAAERRRVTLSQLATEIRALRTKGSVSSVIRLFVLGLCRDQLSELQK